MDTLAGLIRRSSHAWEPGVERAIFDTGHPDTIAQRIEDLVAERFVAVDHALFYRPGAGVVAALALVDGSEIVVKVHRWNVTLERLVAVQRVQALLADAGLPAPRPLMDPCPLGKGIATAEEMLSGQSADAGHRSVRKAIAVALHRFIRATTDISVIEALGAPLVLRPLDAPLWPEPHEVRLDFEATADGAEWIDDLAMAARQRLQAAGDDVVVGHFDWRVENLGFAGRRVVAIYDWDSVCVAPEAVVVGNTAAQFTVDWSRGEPDPLPSLGEMRSFVDDYEQARGRRFSSSEWEQLDAANLALCTYGARCQHSDTKLHPVIGSSSDNRWIRLLRERGEQWSIGPRILDS
jgi:hypothetical protein